MKLRIMVYSCVSKRQILRNPQNVSSIVFHIQSRDKLKFRVKFVILLHAGLIYPCNVTPLS